MRSRPESERERDGPSAYRGEGAARLQVKHPIKKLPNEVRLKSRNLALVKKQEALFDENDQLKKELDEVTRKQQQQTSSTPVVPAP